MAPWLGVILKDLRVVFRSPSEAGLLLMPAAAMVPMAIAVGAKAGDSPIVASGAMSGIAFFALTGMSALISVEAVGSGYMRSLPLKTKWVLGAKAAVTTVTYIASMLVLVAVAVVAGRGDTGMLFAFGASQTFSAAAASVVVGTILQQRAGGGRRISPYASPLDYTLAITAGGITAILPTVASIVGPWFGLQALPLHFGAGAAEAIAALGLLTLEPAGLRKLRAQPTHNVD